MMQIPDWTKTMLIIDYKDIQAGAAVIPLYQLKLWEHFLLFVE